MSFEIRVQATRAPGGSAGPAAPGAAAEPRAGDPIRIASADLVEDRYHRLRLMSWWDQELLRRAVVIVAGAGALGNEAIKNLALLGVGHIFVCDIDAIETSNLTRSVLFRQSDVGLHKADVACARAMELNPDVRAVAIHGDLRFTLGLGLVRRAQVVLGCLDNIAARVYLSRHAYRLGKPSIDAGLDHLNGDVYTFSPPDGPCYECRLKEGDRREFRRRQSCLKLSRKELALGKVPTAPTIAAIAAGLQTQVAIRALHGLPVPSGRRLGLYGLTDVFFDITLGVSEDCPAHGWIECLRDRPVSETPLSARGSTLGELLAEVRRQLGPAAYVSLDDDRELIVGLTCAACGRRRAALALAGVLREDEARCDSCPAEEPMAPDLRSQLDGSEGLDDRTLAELGFPPLHILRGRDDASGGEVLIELTGDHEALFGGQAPAPPPPARDGGR